MRSSNIHHRHHHHHRCSVLALVLVALPRLISFPCCCLSNRFVRDCGFLLPADPDAQERLLSAFALAFHRDNRDVFGSSFAAEHLAMAIIALSDSIFQVSGLVVHGVVEHAKIAGSATRVRHPSYIIHRPYTLMKAANAGLQVNEWRSVYLRSLHDSQHLSEMPSEQDLLLLFDTMLQQPLQWQKSIILKHSLRPSGR